MKKIVRTMVIIMFVIGVAVSVWQIYRQLHEYAKGEDTYTDLVEYIEIREKPEPESQSDGEEVSIQWPEVDFTALKKINPDIVAWIYIEGTEINYPVVRGSDNQYYLKHLFDGAHNSSGCIFLDYRNAVDFSDRNSVIYGHHMKNGTMFSSLSKYKEQEYYDNYRVILLMTPDKNYTAELFAGYVSGVKEDSWKIDFGTEDSFMKWLEKVKEASCFKSSITPAVTDKIVTLSTCSYEFENARFVLYGVLTEESDSFCNMAQNLPDGDGIQKNKFFVHLANGFIHVLN